MSLNIYEELKAEVMNCNKCDLGCQEVQGQDPHVMGEGNLDADLMFVAEAPGSHETIHKHPFMKPGKHGVVFTSIIKHLGLAREDVYTTHMVSCRPGVKEEIMPYEAQRCEGYFKRELSLVKPKLVVTFGNTIANSMLGAFKIIKGHGQVYRSEKYDIDMFPLFHPSYYSGYTSTKIKHQYRADIRKLKELIRIDYGKEVA